jgi:uncharacterized protein YndB with AHSA1/START domain
MTHPDFDPGPLADVHTIADGERLTLVFARDLSHPPAAVWRSLTDPAELTAWSPFVADRDLGTPGPVTLTMIDGDERQDLPGEVTRADPPSVLEYTWGDDALRWELERTDAGTRLTLRHTVADREFLSKAAAGWHLCLVVADRLLAGTPIPPIRGEEAMSYGWSDLNEAYSKLLS